MRTPARALRLSQTAFELPVTRGRDTALVCGWAERKAGQAAGPNGYRAVMLGGSTAAGAAVR